MPQVHYIPTMTDLPDSMWMSEVDVAGTCFDAEYYAAWILARIQQGLWHWDCDDQVRMYEWKSLR